MKNSTTKSKTFFAKSITSGTQDTLTIVGFADDKFESTQFLTLFCRKPISSTAIANYTVQIDSDDAAASDAFRTICLTNGKLSANIKEESVDLLGYSSITISFDKISAREFSELAEMIEAITGLCPLQK
ncbi:hypothetical protein [Rhodopirellula baltica]